MVQFFSDMDALNAILADMVRPYSSVFVLVDENTGKYCLPLVSTAIPGGKIITVSSGEENKNISGCQYIWDKLTDQMADRRALLINLGGGVICDMGGFAASCYKRGIDFINIPTTLLAMVDASVGGKTGIDFLHFKNQIGLFSEAVDVLICDAFLKTLDERQIISGMAEVVKHYLIADGPAFIEFSGMGKDASKRCETGLIKKAVAIKSAIVELDPFENDVRKKLNFGHTIGHALETYSLGTDQPLLHGEAVAYGMAVETYIAAFSSLIDEEKAGFIAHALESYFSLKPISPLAEEEILSLVLQDKKNENGIVKMALIDDIGSGVIDIAVGAAAIRDGISYFNRTVSGHIR